MATAIPVGLSSSRLVNGLLWDVYKNNTSSAGYSFANDHVTWENRGLMIFICNMTTGLFGFRDAPNSSSKHFANNHQKFNNVSGEVDGVYNGRAADACE